MNLPDPERYLSAERIHPRELAKGYGFVTSGGERYYFRVEVLRAFDPQLADLLDASKTSPLKRPDAVEGLEFRITTYEGRVRVAGFRKRVPESLLGYTCLTRQKTWAVRVPGIRGSVGRYEGKPLPQGPALYTLDIIPPTYIGEHRAPVLFRDFRRYEGSGDDLTRFANWKECCRDDVPRHLWHGLKAGRCRSWFQALKSNDPGLEERAWRQLLKLTERLQRQGLFSAWERKSPSEVLCDLLVGLWDQYWGDGTELTPLAVSAMLRLNLPGAVDHARNLLACEIRRLPVLSLDIEASEEQIREISVADWDGAQTLCATSGDVSAALETLRHRADGRLLVGHNLNRWDLPRLRSTAGSSEYLSGELWDTLEIQLLLEPLEPAHRLGGTHRAAEDAQEALNLFQRQLTALAATNDLELESRLPGRVREVLDGFRAIGIAPPGARPRRRVVPALAGRIRDACDPERTTVVVLPEALLPVVEHLPHAAILQAEGAAGVALCPEVVEGFDASPPVQVFARRYLQAAERVGRSPDRTLIPPALRFRLQEDPQLWERNERRCMHCTRSECPFFPGQLLVTTYGALASAAVQDRLRKLEGPVLLAVDPDLAGSDATPLPLVPAVLERLREKCLPALGLAPGQRSAPLTREQLLKLNVPEGMLGCRETFWLYRGGDLEYRLHGTTGDVVPRLAQAIGAECRELRSVPEAEEVTVNTVRLRGAPGADDDEVHLYPTSPFRDEYWAALLTPVMSLALREPCLLALSGDREREEVARRLRAEGVYVPAGGTLARRLELIDERGHGAVLLGTGLGLDLGRSVAPLFRERLPENLVLIVEALPLANEGGVASRETPPPDAPGDSPVLEDSDEALDEEEDSPERVPPRAALHTAQLQAELERQAPVLRHLALRLREAAPRSRLVLLDARAQSWEAPPPGLRLMPELFPASPPEQIEARRKHFAEALPWKRSAGPLPSEEQWSRELERIFLRGRGKDGADGAFDPLQRAYLRRILAGEEDLLVTLPTGGGKSVLFQAPALYCGTRSQCLTVVISPLKALIHDQVASLERLGFGLMVESVSSDHSRIEVEDIYRRVAGGEVLMLYVAPERFRSRRFRRILQQRLARNGGLQYWVFDEAHCISHWGLDFRPDYLYAARMVRQLRDESPGPRLAPLILASATVPEAVFNHLLELFQSPAPDSGEQR